MTNNINGVVPPGEVIVDPVTGEDKSRALPRSSNGDQAYNMFRPADMLPPASQGSNAGLVQVQNGVQPQPAVNNVTTPAIVSQPQEQVQTKAAAVDPNSPTDGLNLLAGLVTTPEQEEKMRKASIQSQRIMAVTNALRHIGNVIGTVHGANAQQFNDPVTEEQQRYLREKAVRDGNNMKFMTYQQAKAAQDARARQMENEMDYKNRMLEHYRDQDRRLWARDAETGSYHADLIELRRQKQQLDEDYRRGKLSIDEYNARSRRISAMASAARAGSRGGVGGGKGMDEYTTTTETVYNYDNLGNKTGSTTTKKRTVNGRQQPTQTTKKQLPGNSNSGKKKLP